MAKYPFESIEPKWQKFWDENKTFKTTEDIKFPKEKRRYILDMFPYPSAQGLHVGHPEGYTATDIYCRYLRMKGYNVLHPMGFDSLGISAENYATKIGKHPSVVVRELIEKFTHSMISMGWSIDLKSQIATSDPEYIKWTQWMFIQFFNAGLAYKSMLPMNWCPNCRTTLTNEELEDGKCNRCHGPVEIREKMPK